MVPVLVAPPAEGGVVPYPGPKPRPEVRLEAVPGLMLANLRFLALGSDQASDSGWMGRVVLGVMLAASAGAGYLVAKKGRR